MTQALPKLVTFAEFIEWKPNGGRYELHDGLIVEMPQPVGEHEEIVGFLTTEFAVEYRRLNLSYFIPRQAIVRATDREAGYYPDVLILNRTSLETEPLWKKSSTVTQGASIPLVVEVVSTNWNDDYGHKLADYETLGIPEYWIVDYLALGGRRYIGNPKQPTISVYYLVEGEYQVSQFRNSERIQSPTFPELNLTIE